MQRTYMAAAADESAVKPIKATSDSIYFKGKTHCTRPCRWPSCRYASWSCSPTGSPSSSARFGSRASSLRSSAFLNTVFPKESLTVLDTLANIGLLFILFLVGLKIDLRAIHRTGATALVIVVAGISLPFILDIGTSFVLEHTVNRGVSTGPFLVFMGVLLSTNAFPVLARILAELKLLTIDLGRMAMSAAAVNDIFACIFLALAIALSGSGSPLVSVWVLLTGTGFVVAAFFLLRLVLAWMVQRSPEGEPVKENYICATLSIVLAAHRHHRHPRFVQCLHRAQGWAFRRRSPGEG